MIGDYQTAIMAFIIFDVLLFIFFIAVGAAVLSINSYIKKIYSILEYRERREDGAQSVRNISGSNRS